MTGLRERWSAGETAFGGWCTTGSPFVAEVIGSQGFDYVCVDLQHGLSDLEQEWMLVQALRGTGAEAVIVPMVNSRAEAELAAAACRYPPLGVRSYGPVRAGMLLGSDP